MPVRIRFTGPATLNATITISWAGGYPPGATVTATETFKLSRLSSWQTTIGFDAASQALYYFAALSTDFAVNFTITRIGNDVIVNPKNGTSNVTATTTSGNIIINPSVSQVSILQEPQWLTPAYNPVTFKFFSANYSIAGQRYLVNVYKNEVGSTGATGTNIARFKVTPQIDGTGYIDISKQLSNFLTTTFDPTSTYLTPIGDTSDSYIKYTVGIGEEFQTTWLFQGVTGATGTYAGKALLSQSPTIEAHTYSVGDQINIATSFASGSAGEAIGGLHTVLSVPSAYSVITDTSWTSGGTSTNGVTSYADGRKTAYNDVDISNNIYAFNGARSWVDLPDWYWENWFIAYGSGISPDCQLLTSLRIAAETESPSDRFYMRPNQSIFLNTIVDIPTNEWYVEWDASNEDGSISYESGAFQLSNADYYVKQIKMNPDELIGGSTNYDLIEKIIFRVVDDGYSAVSRYYSVYLDKRCTIEDTEVYFMDRMGSILSFACQLREKETGTIKREQFKQNVTYNETASSYADIYDQWGRGSKITSVNVENEMELNTNWMNNEMSVLFDELLTSPYTWIKRVIPATSELPEKTVYLACTVTETSFEVQKQKNKRLIRKTFSVKLANENIINI